MLLPLLWVPFALVVVAALLLLAAWLEEWALSPRRLIILVARTRNTPEHAEVMVAAESERLLQSLALERRSAVR
jgi:hypothetical protein